MCGITGAIWTTADRAIDAALLDRMTDRLAHRGPDDRGTYLRPLGCPGGDPGEPGVALGMRRLSIIDVAGGHQPISNESGTIWVVFNGEIYNFRQLQRRLEGAGHRLSTRSDTETLVHLYEDEGPGFLRHLNGMFALALWDAPRRRLLLARDRLGEKPLVYRHEPGRLMFASELKSLWEVPGIVRRVDPRSLDEYLTYQYVPFPRTMVAGFAKLPPAHYALWSESGLELGCYWSPDWNHEVDRRPEDVIEELRATMRSSVALRLESEVPLGVFLSGGVDSSIVAGLVQQTAAERVKTFSIGFSVASYDETDYAREVARSLGTEHYEFRCQADAVSILEQLVYYYDDPLADSSAIPTFYLSQLTRQHVTVALSGDGGDELFAGYKRYLAVRLGEHLQHLPSAVRELLKPARWSWLPDSGLQRSPGRRWKRFLEGLAHSQAHRHLEWVCIYNEARRGALYSDEFVHQLSDHDPVAFLEQAYARVERRDLVTAASLVDLLTYLPCDLMAKTDTASMAHGLECRQPYLDHRLVELAAAIPASLKLRGARGKQILIQAFADLLPPRIQRRSKMGFGVPLDHWFRHELRSLASDILLDPRTLARGYFRPEAVRRMLEQHLACQFDHSARLWSLLFFELWQRRWIDV